MMNQTVDTGKNDEDTSPLSEFSNCHRGIVNKLDQLTQLANQVESGTLDIKSREAARSLIVFGQSVLLVHHEEEEQELFPLVIDCAPDKTTKAEARGMIDRLIEEHRKLEALWADVEGTLKLVARGKTEGLSNFGAASLIKNYLAHVRFEEDHFLPFSAQILDVHGQSALGLSLHIRHSDSSGNYYI